MVFHIQQVPAKANSAPEIAKEKYYSQKTDEFEVVDEIVNINIEIKEIPSPWQKFLWLIVLAGLGFLVVVVKGLLAWKRG